MTTLRIAAAGFLLLAGISASAIAQAPGKRPMTIADLITAIRVGDPQVSPDGRRVVFVRTTTDSVTGKRNADIWVVAADGSSRPRPLIAGPGGDDTRASWPMAGSPSSRAGAGRRRCTWRMPRDATCAR
jgi:dipeptidyl aminopeptidase/acylaminoacyl peptidase